jgi:hypothetical protein
VVGGWSWTVAFGKVGEAPTGFAPGRAPGPVVGVAGRSGVVDVESLMVGGAADAAGAGARSGTVGAGAVLRGMVGAGAMVGGLGGTAAVGVGGATGGAAGTVALGACGASAAFSVTRTVSFFSGTLEVCLDGAGDWFSESLMRAEGL